MTTYWVSGQVPGGGWSMDVEASTPEEALTKALERDRSTPHQNGAAYKIEVRHQLPQLPQTAEYQNSMQPCPPVLLTMTR